MGMYTGLILDCYLKEETWWAWWEIFLYLTDPKNNPRPPTLPKHPFFECERWHQIGGCGSAYLEDDFPPNSTFRDLGDDQYHLHISCSLKNYDGEIERFLEWIEKYIDKFRYGWLRYEECKLRTIIDFTPNGFKFIEEKEG